jgi:hypothetical protein
MLKNPGILQGLNEHQRCALGYQGIEIRKAVDHVARGGVFLMYLSRPKRKKKPSHITQVSTTFMLFHVDLLLAFGGNQRLIFINKALRALDGRILVEEWRGVSPNLYTFFTAKFLWTDLGERQRA